MASWAALVITKTSIELPYSKSNYVMKQILQSYRTGDLWLAEVPVPACGRGGGLVRTRSSVVSAGTEGMLLSLAKKGLLGKARARPDLVGFTIPMKAVVASLAKAATLWIFARH